MVNKSYKEHKEQKIWEWVQDDDVLKWKYKNRGKI